MLQSAGQAINVLTKSATVPPLNEPFIEDNEGSELDEDGNTGSKPFDKLAPRKAAFSQHARAFYTTLHEVLQGLRQQTDALVQAGLLPDEAPKKAQFTQDITNLGLGNLDIGYLNSRTRDVGLAKEAELVKEARQLLETFVKDDEQKETSDAMDDAQS